MLLLRGPQQEEQGCRRRQQQLLVLGESCRERGFGASSARSRRSGCRSSRSGSDGGCRGVTMESSRQPAARSESVRACSKSGCTITSTTLSSRTAVMLRARVLMSVPVRPLAVSLVSAERCLFFIIITTITMRLMGLLQILHLDDGLCFFFFFFLI